MCQCLHSAMYHSPAPVSTDGSVSTRTDNEDGEGATPLPPLVAERLGGMLAAVRNRKLLKESDDEKRKPLLGADDSGASMSSLLFGDLSTLDDISGEDEVDGENFAATKREFLDYEARRARQYTPYGMPMFREFHKASDLFNPEVLSDLRKVVKRTQGQMERVGDSLRSGFQAHLEDCAIRQQSTEDGLDADEDGNWR